MPDAREVLRALALGAAILAAGFAVVSAARRPIAAATAAAMNALAFDHLSFGGGRARLRAVAAAAGDTEAALTVDGHGGELTLGFSARREVSLPIVVLVAVVCGYPLDRRARGTCLGLGLPAVLLFAGLALVLLVTWTFANRLPSVFPLGPTARASLDLVYHALLLPPGGRLVAACAIAAALIAWQARARR